MFDIKVYDLSRTLKYIRYFKGQLQGQEQFLKYLSNFIKGKDSSFGWLFAVYEKFKKDAESESANSLFGGEYIRVEHEDLPPLERMEAELAEELATKGGK